MLGLVDSTPSRDSRSTSSGEPIYGAVTGEQSRIVGDVRSLSGGKIVNASLILWIETESALAACPLPPVLRRHRFISRESCSSTSLFSLQATSSTYWGNPSRHKRASRTNASSARSSRNLGQTAHSRPRSTTPTSAEPTSRWPRRPSTRRIRLCKTLSCNQTIKHRTGSKYSAYEN